MTKNDLKRITDVTINELLNNEVIMPSNYFECFSNNARKVNINISDANYNKNVENAIFQEYNTIENYMNSITEKSEQLNDSINQSKEAIKNKDTQKLTKIYEEIEILQKELDELRNDIYTDETSKSFNRKWIYKKFLKKDLTFKDSGYAVLVNILNLDYIQKEYGDLITTNLVVFIVNKLREELKNHNLKFKVARFTHDQLIFFVSTKDESELKSIFIAVANQLETTTLRSNSGILINGSIKYYIKNYAEKQDSKDVFEALYIQQNS